jgi:hypothetical protein
MTILNTSEHQLLQHLVRAVNDDDLDSFEDHVGMGRAYFDDATVVRLLNEHLPLALDVSKIPTLLLMLTGDDYPQTVEAFVGELMQVAASNGLEIGVDLIADREDGLMVLRVSPRAMAWAEEHYPPYALQQCRPWLRALASPDGV